MVSSTKDDEEYIGENPNVNPEEELLQRGNGIEVVATEVYLTHQLVEYLLHYVSFQAKLSKFVEKTDEQPVRLLVQVARCKQCHWATTCKEELQKHIARHHTDNMRWW